MAASRKKVVTKDDLKRFMKEKQCLTKATTKRLDHPLAKYNSLNQLVCVLCNNVIKNDLLWNAHIQSKQHKEKAIALKTQGPAKPAHLDNSQGTKRKADTPLENNVKKKATEQVNSVESKGLPSDFFDDDAHRKETREKAKAALLAGYSSSSEEESDDEDGRSGDAEENSSRTQPDSSSASNTAALNKGLPADFFDTGIEPSSPADESKTDKPESSQAKKMSEILPEGFFDDPKMDAKVRKVEYKDKMDEEWDLFQRAMKEEAHVSEVIMEEEDEQANLDRNIDEIDDQMHRWQEVENLHVKKETILKTMKDGLKDKDDDNELDEEDLDQFLEWRAKKVMK